MGVGGGQAARQGSPAADSEKAGKQRGQPGEAAADSSQPHGRQGDAENHPQARAAQNADSGTVLSRPPPPSHKAVRLFPISLSILQHSEHSTLYNQMNYIPHSSFLTLPHSFLIHTLIPHSSLVIPSDTCCQRSEE